MIWINSRAIKSPTFKRKADCHRWLAEQRTRKHDLMFLGEQIKLKDKMPIHDFCELWLKSKIASGLAPNTILNYKSYIKNHLVSRFAAVDIKEIQKTDLETLQRQLKDSHNPKGVNTIMTMVKSIFKDAYRDGYIGKNPAEFISKLKENPLHETFWTKAEIDQFLWFNYTHPLYPFILIALNTGMRKGELGGLCWDRVDFSLNQISITRTRDENNLRETTKTNLKRVIPMNQIARATLLNLFNKRSDSPFVFINSNGKPIDIHHVYRIFCILQKRAGMNRFIRFHDLRHTFASQFIMNKGSVFDLQKILGHTDIKMTMRYAHYSMDHLHNAINNFELGGNLEEFNQNLTKKFENAQKVVCF
jgi:integrase